ncbi:hypothetical protein D3OALGB2SA_5583 [Olavius algarvensis associated proteobacterium Delta 3]|nr:hypothetical protein D3OALGB2SA_5583 [Olavius algarvensis associated proteobacterium Delta 3]
MGNCRSLGYCTRMMQPCTIRLCLLQHLSRGIRFVKAMPWGIFFLLRL